MQLISFTANLDRKGEKIIVFIIKEAHGAIQDFSRETATIKNWTIKNLLLLKIISILND